MARKRIGVATKLIKDEMKNYYVVQNVNAVMTMKKEYQTICVF